MLEDVTAQVDRSTVLGQGGPNGQRSHVLNGVHQKSTRYVRFLTYKYTTIINNIDTSLTAKRYNLSSKRKRVRLWTFPGQPAYSLILILNMSLFREE